jgi:hypothetical protein
MVTKRVFGFFLLIAGLLFDISILIFGRLGAGEWAGIGPVEFSLLVTGLCLALLGVPLLSNYQSVTLKEGELAYKIPQQIEPAFFVWVSRLLWIIVLCVFIGYLIVFFIYAIDLFKWPYDYDQGESFELYDAVLHSQGQWPYRDSSVFPFYSSNYPPLFHLVNVLLFPIFGATLLSGRILSFSITILTAILIGLTVYRRTGGILLPLISGLGYTASNFVYHIGPLCRQHLFMVLLETLSVYFIAGVNHPKHGKRNLLLGLACLFLAGYTKQLAVFTAAAIYSFLLLLNPKRAVGLLLIFGAIFGLVFALITVATNGYWWVNTISANVNEYLIPQLIGLVRTWFRIHPVYIICAVIMVGYELYYNHLSVYSLWFIFSLGTGLMSGKWGAGEAYWITSVAAAIILTGFALGRIQQLIGERHVALAICRILIPLFLMLQAVRMLHIPTQGPVFSNIAQILKVTETSAYADYPYYDTVGYSQVGHLMLPRDYDGGKIIMDYVNQADGLVLSEEAAFTMLAGKQVISNPTQLLNLYNNGLLDTTKLDEMIQQRRFDLIIMRAQFYPPPTLSAIGQNYGTVEYVPMNGFNYIVMKPLGQTAP